MRKTSVIKILYSSLFLLFLCNNHLIGTTKLQVKSLIQQPSTTTESSVSFGKTAFASDGDNPVLFVGAKKFTPSEENLAKNYALAQLKLLDGEKAHFEALGDNIAEEQVLLLAVKENKYPLFTTESKKTSVLLIENFDTKNTIETEDETPKDANGDAIDNPIAALAASKDYIFAAVPEAGTLFGADDATKRGIAVLKKKSGESDDDEEPVYTLTQIDAPALNHEADTIRARHLDAGVTERLIAFHGAQSGKGITHARIGNDAAMWWEPELKRLYIGLTNVHRNDNTKEGGVLGVAMGYVDQNGGYYRDGAFDLTHIIRTPKKDLFYGTSQKEQKNIHNRIIGFYYDQKTNLTEVSHKGTNEIQVSIPHIRTMHTSTNKYYLIVNSIMSTNPVALGNTILIDAEDWVYALPLISDDSDKATNGTIARVKKTDEEGVPELDKNNKFQTPTEFDHMPTRDHVPVCVGGKTNPVAGSWITDLFVNGDSVYIALAGPKKKDAGIFKSTAIFNKDGFIAGWTPSERVMGSAIKVFGAGLDIKTGNFYFISTGGDDDPTQSASSDTGEITTWGKGETSLQTNTDTDTNTSTNKEEQYLLSNALADIFDQETGGVHEIFNFPRKTFGYANLSMLVALGYDSVALIQTGAIDDGEFKPTQKFSTKDLTIAGQKIDKTIILYSDQKLKDIAPLCQATVAKDGSIFVGGYHGVAKLQLATGQTSLKAAATGKSWDRFAEKIISKPVFGLGTGKVKKNESVIILTQEKLYTFNVASDTNATYEPTVSGGSDLVVMSNPSDTDNSVGVIATKNGIQYTTDFQSLTPVTHSPSGITIQLQQLSNINSDGQATLPSTVYALVLGQRQAEDGEELTDAQSSEIIPQVYRIAVTKPNSTVEAQTIDTKNDGNKKIVAQPFLQLKELRTKITTDGSLLFNMVPKNNGLIDFVRITPISSEKLSSNVLKEEKSILNDLDLDWETSFHVSTLARDTASGAWVVPGDWGVRVNR